MYILVMSHDVTSCSHSFMYPVTIGTNMPSVNDYKYGVEQLFIDLLQDSHYSVPAKVSRTSSLLVCDVLLD